MTFIHILHNMSLQGHFLTFISNQTLKVAGSISVSRTCFTQRKIHMMCHFFSPNNNIMWGPSVFIVQKNSILVSPQPNHNDFDLSYLKVWSTLKKVHRREARPCANFLWLHDVIITIFVILFHPSSFTVRSTHTDAMNAAAAAKANLHH